MVDTDDVADDERVDTREPDTDELERTLREALGEALTLPLPDALGLPDGEREPLRDGAAVREPLAHSEDEPVPRKEPVAAPTDALGKTLRVGGAEGVTEAVVASLPVGKMLELAVA